MRYPEVPLSISQIWKTAIILASSRFSQLYIIFFFYSALALIPYLFWQDPLPEVILTEHLGGFVTFTVIYSFLASFIMPFVFHQLGTLMEGVPSKFSESLKVVIDKGPTLIGMFIVTTIIFLLGLICFILPGIFFLVAFSMCPLLIIFNNVSIFASISKSIQLVWGNWWRTFIVIYTPIIIAALLVFFATTILSYLLDIFHVTKNTIAWISVFLQVVINPFVEVFLYPALLLQFHDLKIRRNLKKQENPEQLMF